MKTVLVARTNKDGKMPIRATAGAAGFDLYGSSVAAFAPCIDHGKSVSVPVGHTVTIQTGLAFEIPSGMMGMIYLRSSIARLGWVVGSTPIDSDYRGEVSIVLTNASCRDPMTIRYVERIAQIVFLPVPEIDLVLTDWSKLSETPRGGGGFGSTGRE